MGLPRVVLCTALGVPACTPEPRPEWLIEAPRSLGLVQEVTQPGPFSAIEPDAPRTTFEALPWDTFRLTPLIADRDGPIPPERLDFAWYLCRSSGCALSRIAPLSGTACPAGIPYNPGADCWLGRGPAVEASLAPASFDGPVVDLGVVTLAPTVLVVGGSKDHATPEECGARFLEARDLEDCIFMFRTIHLGPVRDLVAVAQSTGVDVQVSESQQPLLEIARNHNPSARTFFAEPPPIGHGDGSLDPRVPLSWPAGTEVVLRYAPDPVLDLEPAGGSDDVQRIDSLRTQWYATHPDAELDPALTSVRLDVAFTVPHTDDPWFLTFVVRDDRGGEDWATFTIRAESG